ncbi:MAG: hypothetical protein ABR924_02120 [Terracidiphilus sp.]|jgi:uncharacterized membrane protein
MNEPLRPSSLSEILDRTVQLYRARFLVFLGISLVPTALVLVPVCGFALLFGWLGSNGAGSATPGAEILAGLLLIGAVLVAVPVLLGAVALAMAAMSHAAARAHLGEKVTIRGAYKAVWRRGWHYVWLLILEGLFIGAAPLAAWIAIVSITAGAAALLQRAGAGSADTLLGWAVVLFAVALFGCFVWMLLRLSLAFPACVVEETGAWTAIRRSNSLSKGTKGRIFLLFLLAAVLNWIVSIAIILTLAIVVALIPGLSGPQYAQTVDLILGFFVYGVGFAVQALIRPVYGIALTLFYYDQRIRLEGFDIEWMMQQAGLVAPPPSTPVAAPWLPPIPRQPRTSDREPPQTGEIQQPTEPPPAVSGESR